MSAAGVWASRRGQLVSVCSHRGRFLKGICSLADRAEQLLSKRVCRDNLATLRFNSCVLPRLLSWPSTDAAIVVSLSAWCDVHCLLVNLHFWFGEIVQWRFELSPGLVLLSRYAGRLPFRILSGQSIDYFVCNDCRAMALTILRSHYWLVIA